MSEKEKSHKTTVSGAAPLIDKKEKLHKNIFPGLDALIGDHDWLKGLAGTMPKAEHVIIPTYYTEKCRRFRNEQTSRGEAANKLVAIFARMTETIHRNSEKEYVCANGMRVSFQKELAAGEAKSTAAITVLAAKWFIENSEFEDRQDTAILTGDDFLVTEASLNGIDVAHVNPEEYTGRRKLTLTAETMDAWCKYGYITQEMFGRNFPNEAPLNVNEFVHFDPFEDMETDKRHFTYYIGRFEEIERETEEGEKVKEYVIQQIHYIHNLPKFIQPRTPGQAMFAEAIMAPASEIPIVICPAPFGTGKTFMATAIGAQLTIFDKNPTYDTIFVCPRDGELGKEIGFLPGDETAKTLAKARPITDNLEAYLKLRGDKEKDGKIKSRAQIQKDIDNYIQSFFEFVAMIHMGGRSLKDKYIIYDEMQDTERYQMRELLSRIGDGSKVIIIGDPNQISNPHLSKHSNGLNYAATKMRGSECAIVVEMYEDEITRSKAAREVARRVS